MKYNGTYQVLFIIFIILVSIAIMNLLVGLAITNITTVFQTSGILRLKITITLVKIVEDMMLSAQKIAPFLISGIQILPKNM